MQLVEDRLQLQSDEPKEERAFGRKLRIAQKPAPLSRVSTVVSSGVPSHVDTGGDDREHPQASMAEAGRYAK